MDTFLAEFSRRPYAYVGCWPRYRGFEHGAHHLGVYWKDQDGHPRLVVDVAGPGTVSSFYRLAGGDVLERIDGRPPPDAAAFRDQRSTWPAGAPSVIEVTRGAKKAEIRYVSLDFLRSVEEVLRAAGVVFDDSARWPPGVRADWSRIMVGDRMRAWDPEVASADTLRLNRAANRVFRMSRTSRHRPSTIPRDLDCRSIRDALIHIAVIRKDRSLELASIDWIESGARSSKGPTTSKPPPTKSPCGCAPNDLACNMSCAVK